MKKLNDWFSIDEREYLMYLLKGYEISVKPDYVIWFINGKAHREDGPAYINKSGFHSWWLNDKRYTENTFNEKIKQLV